MVMVCHKIRSSSWAQPLLICSVIHFQREARKKYGHEKESELDAQHCNFMFHNLESVRNGSSSRPLNSVEEEL